MVRGEMLILPIKNHFSSHEFHCLTEVNAFKKLLTQLRQKIE